jgi:hypothetical protein
MDYKGSGNYESFYGGDISSFNPEYGHFTGYRIAGGQLGQTTNPASANQLDETVKTLKTGVRHIEVAMLGPAVNDLDQTIPKEHFKEIRALMKLSGATTSLHGPIIDPAGFVQNGVDETERINAERRFFDAVEKGHELNPKGNTTVVFHASNGMPGGIFTVDESKKPGEEGRLIKEKGFAINQDTGQVAPLKRERKFYPEYPDQLEKGKLQTVESQLNSINATEWESKMTELAQFNKHADEVIGSSELYFKEERDFNVGITREGQAVLINPETKEVNPMTPAQEKNYQNMKNADIFLENVSQNFRGIFNKAYEYGSPEQQKELKKLASDYKEGLESFHPTRENPNEKLLMPIYKKNLLQGAIMKLNQITEGGHAAPEIYTSTEEFALNKSSETFANTAVRSYKEFGKNMPVIAIENWAPGMAFNRGEDLKKLVETTREKFAEKLNKEKNIGLSKARKIAEKQIGATWDVGHINMHKKYGLTDEDIVRETQEVASVVKHLHLTDNFGFSDSHLVPGMGNVPFKKHLEKLEKEGVLDKVKKIVEAGGYIKDISQKGAHSETLTAFGSSIYGAKMAPYWNQTIGLSGGYSGGFGMINPQTHHSIYGAGFSNLPTELGGQIPGGGSRFSGNPMS